MRINTFKSVCPCPSQQPECHDSKGSLKVARVQGPSGTSALSLWGRYVCRLTAGSAQGTHHEEASGGKKINQTHSKPNQNTNSPCRTACVRASTSNNVDRLLTVGQGPGPFAFPPLTGHCCPGHFHLYSITGESGAQRGQGIRPKSHG